MKFRASVHPIYSGRESQPDSPNIYYGFKYNGNFTTIVPPNTTNQTQANDINDSGNIVGFYNDNSGTNGFLYDGKQYADLNYPGATGTGAMGINSDNKVVGYYAKVSDFGFLFDGSYH